ncbi:MAG: cyclic nucleotide-binding domain-containing protein [Gammaproteobacteria bacterium]|nr:cyclic nucleotide-binding domain-containing protein [Gammaproteobacteria bacterium]
MKIEGFGQSAALAAGASWALPQDTSSSTHLCRPELGLYLLCEPAEPSQPGLAASARAIEIIEAEVERQMADWPSPQAPADDPAASSEEALRERLLECARLAMSAANQALVGPGALAAASHPASALLLLTHGDRAVMAHIGACRLYLYRRGELHCLSRDHTYSEAPDDPYGEPDGELGTLPLGAPTLTRGLGLHPAVLADTLVLDVMVGDFYLLCTRSLHAAVEADGDPLCDRLSGVSRRDLQHLPGELLGMLTRPATVSGSTGMQAGLVVVHAYPEPRAARREQARDAEVSLCLEALQSIALFRHLSMPELLQVLDTATLEVVAAGQTVIEEGVMSQQLYVVVDGSVAVDKGGSRLAELGPGSHFGEMSLLNARPRSASVHALEASRLLSIERGRFIALLRKDSALGMKLLWALAQVLSRRLHDTTDLLGSVAGPGGEGI